MKKRVITGAVLVAFLIFILWLNIPLVDTLFIFSISLIGMYEYNKAFKSAGYNIIPFIGYLSCVPILLMGLDINPERVILIARIIIPFLLMYIFIYSIFIANLINFLFSLFLILSSSFIMSSKRNS